MYGIVSLLDGVLLLRGLGASSPYFNLEFLSLPGYVLLSRPGPTAYPNIPGIS